MPGMMYRGKIDYEDYGLDFELEAVGSLQRADISRSFESQERQFRLPSGASTVVSSDV